MNFFLAILLLAVTCNAAPQQPFNYNSYISSQTTTPAPFIHPPAQVHYVNIGQELNGDYKFGYDTGKGPSGQSFREETRLPDGTVKGQYGYLDAQNKMRIVKYTAGLNGFSIDSDTALNDQQLAASRPSQPVQTERQSTSSYSERPAFQGLASAASNQPTSIAQYQHQYPGYVPLSNSAAVQQPYTGYSYNPQSQYNLQQSQYNPSAYQQTDQPQVTAAQLQQQALAAARARQAALARQQQQEAIIRQQQQAATEAILAQQKAAQAAHEAATQSQQSHSNQYSSLSAQYNLASYQQSLTTPPSATTYQAPATPSYLPRHTVSEQKPDLLSNFIQLPGVKLIQLDRKPTTKPNSFLSLPTTSFGLNGKQEAKTPEDDYQGPVVINAALLSYNIGANQQPQAPATKKA